MHLRSVVPYIIVFFKSVCLCCLSQLSHFYQDFPYSIAFLKKKNLFLLKFFIELHLLANECNGYWEYTVCLFKNALQR